MDMEATARRILAARMTQTAVAGPFVRIMFG